MRRLWHYAESARRYVVVTVVLSAVVAGCIVVQGVVVARVLAGVITDPGLRNVAAWGADLAVILASLVIRVVATWWQARIAHRAGASVVAELEAAVVAAGTRLSERELDTRRGELAVVVSTGLAGLRPYLTGYLPALMLALLVPPVVLVVIATQDLVSAAIIAVTLPLVPVFMILIGLLSKGKADDTLRTMTRLSDRMMDLFAGLPTLRALGRQHGPEQRVADLGDAHRRTTLSALRVAFLSSMVLELLATLCVALVAVSIGMRLVFGDMALAAGLAALILAPEVYLPLRAVGERFHAAEDGKAAANKAFGVLDQVAAQEVSLPRSTPGELSVTLTDLTMASRGSFAPYALTATCRPGTVTVLSGPNGSGKSSALQAILGLLPISSGRIQVGGVDVGALRAQDWWSHVAWLPQRPVLVPGTLRHNVELLGARVGAESLDNACMATGFAAVLASAPNGWDTVVGPGGAGLSLGERQRLALARVLASDKSVLLLDEPTAHLDVDSEGEVLAALVRRAERGATVIVVGHRPAVLAAGDVIVEVQSHAHAE